MVVLFPLPLGPEKPVDVAPPDHEAQVFHRDKVSEMLGQALELQGRNSAGAAEASLPGLTCSGQGLAEPSGRALQLRGGNAAART